MKKFFAFLLFTFAFCVASVAAQDCPHPSGCVVVSRDAAVKALKDEDTVKAQAVEIAGFKQAIEDFRKELNKIRIEFAEKVGENTALKQNAVADRAIMEILVKNSHKRCAPFSILCL